MSICSEAAKAQGLPYPRTCSKCGLGPCTGGYAPKAPAAIATTAPELAYAVLWSYPDRSGFGVVSVHRTKPGADRMADLLSKHSDTKTFTVEPVPSEP